MGGLGRPRSALTLTFDAYAEAPRSTGASVWASSWWGRRGRSSTYGTAATSTARTHGKRLPSRHTSLADTVSSARSIPPPRRRRPVGARRSTPWWSPRSTAKPGSKPQRPSRFSRYSMRSVTGRSRPGCMSWGGLFWPSAGLWAAALFVSHPLFLRWVNFVWDMYAALALFVGLIVAAVSMSRRRPGPAGVGFLGGGLGVLMLINASYVFTAPLTAARDGRSSGAPALAMRRGRDRVRRRVGAVDGAARAHAGSPILRSRRRQLRTVARQPPGGNGVAELRVLGAAPGFQRARSGA